jgi:translocation and assembly module TamB
MDSNQDPNQPTTAPPEHAVDGAAVAPTPTPEPERTPESAPTNAKTRSKKTRASGPRLAKTRQRVQRAMRYGLDAAGRARASIGRELDAAKHGLAVVGRGLRPLGRGLIAVWRGMRWFGLWLPGAVLALLLGGVVALWFWAATPGSLAQTLAWAQGYTATRADSTGAFSADNVQGSLRAGGTVQQLHWARAGLSVQASGVRLRLGPQAWTDALLGRGLHLDALHIDHLRINEQRPPSPTEALQSLTLPLAVTLPWSVDQVDLQGAQTLQLSALKGLYRYGPSEAPLAVPDAHRLTLESLQFGDGQYRAQATLGAQSPMPLSLDLQGSVTTQMPGGSSLQLQASAQALGTLGGPDAALDINARVQAAADPSSTPTLVAQAHVMPWAAQPLVRADATAHQLNLAALWPQAPTTALSGTLQAQPDGDTWRANVNLSNSASGPADRQRLPLQSLQGQLAQQGSRWTLTGLDASVGGGGRLQGNLQFSLGNASPNSADTWQGQLQLSRINPAQLWSTLAPAALDGSLSARTARAGIQPVVDLNALIRPSGRQPAGAQLAGLRLRELQLQGHWQPSPSDASQGRLTLREAHIHLADAQLQASGEYQTASRQFQGQLALQWPGAQAQWQGLLAHNSGEGRARLQLEDARRTLAWVRSLQTLPVFGPPLRAWLDSQPGLGIEGSAQLSAQWQGGLGALGYPAPAATPNATASVPRLQATLDVPQLVLQPGIQNNTEIAHISLSALRLHVDGRLDDLQLVTLGTLTQAPWSAQIDTQGRLKGQRATNGLASWQTGQLDLSRLLMRISDASRKDRVIQWGLQNAQPVTARWRATDQGLRLDGGTGRLQLLPTVRHIGSATTSARRPAADLGNTPLDITWYSLVWHANSLQTRGRLSDLPLAWVEVLGTVEGAQSGPLTRAGLSGNLVFEGQWDVVLPTDASTPLNLTIALQRSSGDLTVQTDANTANSNGQRVQAGIEKAELSISAQGNTLQASLRWASERLGEAAADVSTEITPRAAPNPDGSSNGSSNTLDNWWPANATLRGSASAQLPQVGVWSALAPPGWRMHGTLQANAELGGTRNDPQWSGQLQADQLGLRSVVDGFAFTDGQLRATLADDKITIQRFSLQGPRGTDPGGSLEATGSAEWRTPPGSPRRQVFIELQANAAKLRVSTRADRRITLTGQINAQLAGPRLTLRGQLTADTALFILPDELAPTLSSDVVKRGTLGPAIDPNAEPVQPDIQIDLDLGQQFDVRGRGLQTRLSGQLSVRSTPDMPTPRVLGEVRTLSGTYRAYGQQLSIDTGVLRFTGPFDDPTLDILAMRPQPISGAQRVGVQITGSAQSPRVRLYADPELPDSEKLAWLVLGRPATGAGAEAAVLQQAAMALLTRNNSGADAGFASLIGLDELGFTGQTTNADGTTTAAALTVGKRISNDLYLAYERSLAGTMGTVSIFYDLSRRLTLRARAGEENAIDLIFTQRYD